MNLSISLKPGVTQDKRQNHASRVRFVLGVIASLLYVIVRLHTPISMHAENIHDDQLFVSMGQRIASGQWLGAYNQMTLIKGPGYPLFLAVNAWLGTQLSLSEALFHGFAIGTFFWLFARISHMPTLAVLGYITTLWMPAPYLELILRDSIYPAQMLLIVAGMAATFYVDMSRKLRFTCALSTGLVLGWFFLTREEGIWILPGLSVIALGTILMYRHNRPLSASVLAPLAIVALGYGVTQVTVSSINKVAYGSFVRVEINSSPFKDAIAALQAVQVGKPIPYVPVSKRAREAIYQISPSFRKLKAYLDPPTGSPWQFGCRFYPDTCGDIAGGWFMWAVRDAVATTGLYGSPRTAARFYRELTTEVHEACTSGKLQCKALPVSMVPRISPSQWNKLPQSLLNALRMVTLHTPPPTNIPSTGPAADLKTDTEFLGSPLRTSSSSSSSSQWNIYNIAGWYYGKDQKGWIKGRVTSGDEVSEIHIVRRDSPDLATGFQDIAALHQRFNTTINCQPPCSYAFSDESGASVDINLADQVGHPSHHQLGDAILNIDQLTVSSDSESTANISSQRHFAATWRGLMERSYGQVLPWALPLSLFALLIVLVTSALRRTLTATTVLAAALWTLFASRLTLLALVDISSFPGIIVPYLSPAYVLACLTPIISFAALYELLSATKRQPRKVTTKPEIAHF